MFFEGGLHRVKLFILCRGNWRTDLQVYPYLRCSFFLLFWAFCIKHRLFYRLSPNVTVAVEVQYLTPAPQGDCSADNQPRQGPRGQCRGLRRPRLAPAWMTSHRRRAWKSSARLQ